MVPRLFLLTLILFLLELGLLLVALPWSSLWEFSYFRFRFPTLTPYLLNDHLRGLVSGLGLVDLGVAFWYVAHFDQVLGAWLERPPFSRRPPEALSHGRPA